jgi:hypothetical protein
MGIGRKMLLMTSDFTISFAKDQNFSKIHKTDKSSWPKPKKKRFL